MLDISEIKQIEFDVLVIGAGGAGLCAAISAAKEAQAASDKATIDEKIALAFANIDGINAFADAVDTNAKAAVAAASDESGISASATKVSEMVANVKAWANAASATATNDVQQIHQWLFRKYLSTQLSVTWMRREMVTTQIIVEGLQIQ